MPRRSTAPIPAEEPERIEKRGHLDQPLLLLTMLLLGMGLLCLFSASYATAYDDFNGNSTHFIFRQGIFAAGGVVVMLVASKEQPYAEQCSAILAKKIEQAMETGKIAGVTMIGPADAALAKINDIYKKVIYFKHKDYTMLVRIKDALEEFTGKHREFLNVTIQFDFNPMSSI